MLMGGKRRAEDDQDAAEQEKRKKRLRIRGETLVANHQHAEKDDGGVGQQNLAEPDVVSRDAVMKSELEHAAEQVSHDQCQRGGVRPKNCDVGQRKEPCAEKSVVVAEEVLRIGKRAACIRVFLHHRDVIPTDDEHDKRADQHSDCRADRSGNRQECRARHDESTPTHSTAERQRPDGDRGQIAGKSRFVQFCFVRIFHEQSLFSTRNYNEKNKNKQNYQFNFIRKKRQRKVHFSLAVCGRLLYDDKEKLKGNKIYIERGFCRR